MHMRSSTETCAKAFFEGAQATLQQVVAPLHAMRETAKQNARKHTEAGLKMIKELAAALQLHDRTRQRYINKCMEVDAAQVEARALGRDPSANPKQLEQVSKKVKKLIVEEEALCKEYRELVTKTNNARVAYEKKMIEVLQALQKIDHTRISDAKRLLQRAVEIQRSRIAQLSAQAVATEQLVNAIDADLDIQTYIAEQRTGKPKDPELVFEAYQREVSE
jgi:hypothetical protein